MKKYLSAVSVLLLMFFVSTAHAAKYVIPSGRTVGIKIYTDGLTVTGVSEFTDISGDVVCPAKDAGIVPGNVIKTVNGNVINSCEEFEEMLNGEDLDVEIIDNGKSLNTVITPQRCEDGVYRIGAWVRDSTAGIGTITCYDAQSLTYNALGHAVTDVDTGSIMTVKSGNIQKCRILEITKSGIGFPGSVSAEFLPDTLGTVEENSDTGISGKLCGEYSADDGKSVEAAGINDVHDGDVTVLTDVCGETAEYAAQIKVISKSGIRNMIIEITDEKLLEKTGGIVQGMSGVPVMQDGKLIGAITHVFINNPRKGYCISAEKFLK